MSSIVKSDNSDLTINADGSGKEVKIQRDGTEVLATTSTGIDVTGNVVLAAGKGIDFSATSDGSGTMTSEVLDDYETGTIDISTMNFTGSGSLTTQTAGNVLEYIKIGDLVTITGNIYVGVVTSQSGDLKIPLPFAAKNTVGTRAPGVIASYSQNIVAVAKVEQNNTYARLVKPYLWGVVNISNNDTYVVGISYIAA